MGLLAQYGSDSENSASETDQPAQVPTPKPSLTTTNPKKRPIKITSQHALLKKSTNSDDSGSEGGQDVPRPEKRIKLASTGSKGTSGLLGILPPPKRSNPISKKGGPSLGAAIPVSKADVTPAILEDKETREESPPSVIVKGKGKAAVNFFGIEPDSAISTPPGATETPLESAFKISAAPSAPEPSPLPSLYPGQPSETTFDANGRLSQNMIDQGAMGHAWRTVDQVDETEIQDYNVRKNLEKTRKMEEERAKLLAPTTFQEETQYKPTGKTTGLAGKRHQLSALLKDAHSNRQALEERIAANKRTKRESGSKYGF